MIFIIEKYFWEIVWIFPYSVPLVDPVEIDENFWTGSMQGSAGLGGKRKKP